ncbi:DUF7620 family protein [Streptomyces zaomyceticus]|uniref:DUF7620 family protein n=1 Tax=Streptomyces zaomyceticus TaxID=68286 RepID=UPI0037AE5803
MWTWLKRLIGKAGPTQGLRDANGALARAQRASVVAKARLPEVQAVAAGLRQARYENHFAEKFAAAYKGVPDA